MSFFVLLLRSASAASAQPDPPEPGEIETSENAQVFKGAFTAKGRLFHAQSGCRWTETWTFSNVRFDLSQRLATFTNRLTQVPLVPGCPHGDQSAVRRIPVAVTGTAVTGATRWGSYNVSVQATINGVFLNGTFKSTATTPFNGTDSGTFRLGEAGCEIKLADSKAARGSIQRLTAELTPHPSFQLRSVQWRFTGGNGGLRNSGRQLFTDVILVDGRQQYTATVTASSTVAGAECQATARLTVAPRSWKTTPKVKLDNEPGWGALPAVGARAVFGAERDRASNTDAIIIPSPTVHQAWENGYRVARVKDPNGPNNGYSYVQSTSLDIDQETVINKWIKPSGPRPLTDTPNWFQANESCLPNPTVFVNAIKNHENSGSGPGSTGHFGLIRAAEASAGLDPRTAIEDNAEPTEARLITATNRELALIELFLIASSSHQYTVGNWSGVSPLSFWNASSETYSDCIYRVGPY